ncbi:glycosyltransferase family 4 protein [Pelagibius sp. 7325]|uniref:glycosyltransferase family 4 protein n=1 Tax=Pelagibius sp. 7325 TaxID=3131994 RepID=UPI0030EB8DF3
MATAPFDAPLRILTFTTLYPNAAKPQHGVFVENRLRHLVASGEVSARVLAPIPYFPFTSGRFGTYAVFARAPRHEERHGIAIDHPRYPTIPKVGMSLAPWLLYTAARRALGNLLRAGQRFDLIDAHYFYPDGVAAVMLGQAFGLPVVITARGTDINLIPDYAIPRRLIISAARRAAGVISVSRALAGRMADLGIDPGHITVLRNGVDTALFQPVPPHAPGGEAPPGPLAISVGNLVPLKGHDLAIRAVADIPGLHLWIVGDGPERARLAALAGELGVTQRVRFLGVVPHAEMPAVYSAADLLILASEREGWPNVLLEAMACGAQVVATRVSDVTDMVNTPAAGAWIEERSAAALGRAIRSLLETPLPRAATRAHALAFSWEETTRGQVALFREVLRRRGADGR